MHQTAERGRRKKRYYMYNLFREEAQADMMHLIDEEKKKMAMRYVKYFDTATPRALKLID